jgi:hypothetical protein
MVVNALSEPMLFSLSGRRFRSEGQRGRWPWLPQQRRLAMPSRTGTLRLTRPSWRRRSLGCDERCLRGGADTISRARTGLDSNCQEGVPARAPPPQASRSKFPSKGSVMTHLCCARCRLRFTPAASAYLTACPKCGEAPQPSSLESTLGFGLFGPEDLSHELPQAVVVSVPVPDPRARP